MTKNTLDGMQTISKTLEHSHAGVLLTTLFKALEQVMDSEVQALCGADYGERSDKRTNMRNGYRERTLETRLGTLDLRIPKLREGTYFPSFLCPRRRWEQAFVSVVSEAYVLGVSTRKVDELCKAMGAQGMSKSEVSRLCQTLDAEVQAFLKRRLHKAYPYLWLDAVYLKVREGQRVLSKATLVAYGVSEQGEREVLGVQVADGEMESAWRSFLAGLLDRDLDGVQLVISDAHPGLRKAVRGMLNGTSWQRCTVHLMRNVMARVPKAAQGFVAAALQGIFAQTEAKLAHEALRKAVEHLRPKYPSAASLLEEAEEDVLSYMNFPQQHWRQIHSTNPLERQNREIRRRTDVVGIFPNAPSALRLVTMLLIEQNDEWAVSRRYFSLESMQLLKPPAEATKEPAALSAAP